MTITLMRAPTRGGDPAISFDDGVSGLEVRSVGFSARGGSRLIGGLTFQVRRGSLTAVIGPSGAGKTTLARLLAGAAEPSAGRVVFGGHDIPSNPRLLAGRVGMVPQDDIVHPQLTLARALQYAADLKLGGQLDSAQRAERVARIITMLELDGLESARIDRLSGGQRKRASVAMELLTEPELLVLDEPTSGLDPALDRQVMRCLRRLADAGRTIVVVTHSVAYLDLCDQVLVLATGGGLAYLGPATGIAGHFGTGEWGDIFGMLSGDAASATRRWSSHVTAPTRRSLRSTPTPGDRPPRAGAGWLRQVGILSWRQFDLIRADRAYGIFLALLPFVLGALAALVPGTTGLQPVPVHAYSRAGEPTSVLALLVLSAIFMGTALTIRDLVGERAISRREQATGVRASAYLGSKLVAFGVLSVVDAAVLTTIACLVKPAPLHSVLPFWPAPVELFMVLTVLTWTAAAMGLAISAMATTQAQVMPLLVVILMTQLVFHGGLIPATSNSLFDLVSRLMPARWGFAAAAASVDLDTLAEPARMPGATVNVDALWEHSTSVLLADLAVVAALGVAFMALAWTRLHFTRAGMLRASGARRERVASQRGRIAPLRPRAVATSIGRLRGEHAVTVRHGRSTPAVRRRPAFR